MPTDHSRVYCPRQIGRSHVKLILTLKRQDPQRAARLCSNRADIRRPQPPSEGHAPAPATSVDQAAGSSHRGARVLGASSRYIDRTWTNRSHWLTPSTSSPATTVTG